MSEIHFDYHNDQCSLALDEVEALLSEAQIRLVMLDTGFRYETVVCARVHVAVYELKERLNLSSWPLTRPRRDKFVAILERIEQLTSLEAVGKGGRHV